MARPSRKARRERERRDRKNPNEGQFNHPQFATCLAEWVEHLKAIPPDAPEWDELPDFQHTLLRLEARSLIQRSAALAEEIEDIAASLSKTYRAELNYLEVDVGAWPGMTGWNPRLLPEARDIALELQAALPLYSEVHPRASTRRQEEEREVIRAERLQVIGGIVARWNDLIADASDFDGDLPSEEYEARSDELSLEDYEAALEKVERLERKYAQARSAVEVRTAQRDEARRRVEYLQGMVTQMEQKGGQPVLQDGLAARDAPTDAVAEVEEVDSVSEAVTAAELNFPTRLVIALNSASWEDAPYQRPNEVYAALRWLATEYSDIRLNPPGTDPEFERRLKEACPGWFYSPKQSDTAKNMFRAEYETTFNSRTYTLDTHIGRGKSDPQRMIRIAFDWDGERQQVIVGYIGSHQRTQAS